MKNHIPEWTWMHTCTPSTRVVRGGESGVHGHFQPHNEFEASMVHSIPSLKAKQTDNDNKYSIKLLRKIYNLCSYK